MKVMNLFSNKDAVGNGLLKLEELHVGDTCEAVRGGTYYRSGERVEIVEIQPRKITFRCKRAQVSMLPGDFSAQFILVDKTED